MRIELTLSTEIPEGLRLQKFYDLINTLEQTGVPWTFSELRVGVEFRVFRIADDKEECDRLFKFGCECKYNELVSEVRLVSDAVNSQKSSCSSKEQQSRLAKDAGKTHISPGSSKEQQSTHSSEGWPGSDSVSKDWPPGDLNKNESHILVTIGEPFTPSLQRVKLETFLNKAPSGDKWSLVVLPVNYAGGFCGLVFSTDDSRLFQSELEAVKGMKDGTFYPDGKVCTAPDRTAYTSLVVFDCVAEIERASDNFENVVAEYYAVDVPGETMPEQHSPNRESEACENCKIREKELMDELKTIENDLKVLNSDRTKTEKLLVKRRKEMVKKYERKTAAKRGNIEFLDASVLVEPPSKRSSTKETMHALSRVFGQKNGELRQYTFEWFV